MGKQINYYIGYNDFLSIAQKALDSGCEILAVEQGRVLRSNHISIVTPDRYNYYFYLPEAGPLDIQIRNNQETIGGYNASGNVLIEAGFSRINHSGKTISRARLFSISGYYEVGGEWVERPACMKKLYDKLVRLVKKTAPYTELTDLIFSTIAGNCGSTYEWTHKEYITPELLALKNDKKYKLEG